MAQLTFNSPLVTKSGRAEYIEPEEILPIENGDLRHYLNLCFQGDEHVAVCVDAVGDRPGKIHSFPVSHLLEKFEETTELEDIIGATTEAGAWIGCNPVDSDGCRDKNVTSYRHALLKTSDIEPGKALAMFRQIELPCACIIYSGSDSLHAIVKIEADSLQQYRDRVDYLYKVASQSGLKCDAANRYPSRLTRMPGVKRNDKMQFIVSGQCGKSTWTEWKEFADDLYDDLPDIECAVDFVHNPPPRLPEVIYGVLRKTHKMRVAGPPKAGKSFSLIQLAVAAAEGGQWMGHQVRQSTVLFVNTELDPAEFWNRLAEVYDAMGLEPRNADRIDCWNLRAKCRTLDVLSPKLIGRAKKRASPYDIIILDPIYKVAGSDENNPEEVAALCDCMDRIAMSIGAAFVYCHHHSKGQQGQKTSMDRASGSGVFSRDADSMIDFIELQLSKTRRQTLADSIARSALHDAAVMAGVEFEAIERTAEHGTAGFMQALSEAYPAHKNDFSRAFYDSERNSREMSGWRVEGTFRSFAPAEPTLCWFKWPIHVPDITDLLKDTKAAGEEAPWMDAQRKKQEARQQQKEEVDKKKAGLDAAMEAKGAGCSVEDLASAMGVSEKTIGRWLRNSLTWKVARGKVEKREED